MADPERTMLDRADVGPVVAPAGHSHEDLSQGLAGKADKKHADTHAVGGSDRILPADIGAVASDSIIRTGAGEDLDLMVEPGRYVIGSSAINTPATSTTAHIDVWDRANGDLTYQRFMGYAGNGGNQIWVRSRVGGSWQAWIRVDAGAVTPESIGAVNGVATQIPGAWGDMDANALIEAGRYALFAGTSQNVPALNGFTAVGVLEVMPRVTGGGSTTQVYQRWTVAGHSSGDPTGEWIRGTYDGGATWGSWKRVITDGDPRLFDTKWRDVTSLVTPTLDATSPGQMLIRRQGSIATARFLSLRSATDTAPVVLMTVPLGFRAGAGRAVGLVPVQTSIDTNYRLTAYSTVMRLAGRWTATGAWANGWASGEALTGDLSWFVDEPFPATLPGTPA